MPYLSYKKEFQGVADVFLHDARRYAPLLQSIEAVMAGPSDLTKAEREMIATHVSKLNGCDFCLGAHIWTLTALDIDFNEHAFSAQPGYDEQKARKEFAKLMPLRTIVIYCFDPRAAGIPKAVAKELGDAFPGEVVTDTDGNGIATTATMLNVVVAGGRAMDALRSITVGQHLLGVENVVVVHHTHCGATSYTPEGIIAAFKHEHDADISDTYPRESVAISDYVSSLEYDTQLIRNAAGTPPHVDIYGYVYDIDTGELTRVTEDLGEAGPSLAQGAGA